MPWPGVVRLCLRHPSCDRVGDVEMLNRLVRLVSRCLNPPESDPDAYVPEITYERQAWLARRRGIAPDIERGVYPFGGVKLTSADVEWLLVTHDDLGSVEWSPPVRDGSSRTGLDLRGADLRGENLSGLLLTRLIGGLEKGEWNTATPEQREAAAVHLEEAQIRGAHLQGAQLCGAHLERAHLFDAHLEQAELVGAHLERALLVGAHLEEADLHRAYLEGAQFDRAYLGPLAQERFTGAFLDSAHLDMASFREADLTKAIIRWTHLSGVDFFRARLGGADLESSFFGGRVMDEEDLRRVRRWEKDFPEVIRPANLRYASFTEETRIMGVSGSVSLGEPVYGYASLLSVHWDGLDLTTVDWLSITVLGDEREALEQKRANRQIVQGNRAYARSNTRKLVRSSWRTVTSGRCGRYLRALRWLRRERRKVLRMHKGVSRNTERDAYRRAVRAHRQLATELRNQGMNEEADEFSYRAQRLQREVLLREQRYEFWLVSYTNNLVAGYGYRLWRPLGCYAIVITACAVLYYVLGGSPLLELDGKRVIDVLAESVNAFHGRGLSSGDMASGDPRKVVGAVEAFIGLVVEITLIVTLTQRLFGK